MTHFEGAPRGARPTCDTGGGAAGCWSGDGVAPLWPGGSDPSWLIVRSLRAATGSIAPRRRWITAGRRLLVAATAHAQSRAVCPGIYGCRRNCYVNTGRLASACCQLRTRPRTACHWQPGWDCGAPPRPCRTEPNARACQFIVQTRSVWITFQDELGSLRYRTRTSHRLSALSAADFIRRLGVGQRRSFSSARWWTQTWRSQLVHK